MLRDADTGRGKQTKAANVLKHKILHQEKEALNVAEKVKRSFSN